MKKLATDSGLRWKPYDVVFFIQERSVCLRVFARNKNHAVVRGCQVLLYEASQEVDVIRVKESKEDFPF